MNDITMECLTEKEFEELLFMLPKEILTIPFKKSPKKFRKYIHGFRPQNMSNHFIKIAYFENVYNKKSIVLSNHLNNTIKKSILDPIDEIILSNEEMNFDNADLSKKELKSIVNMFYDNAFKLNILIYLKLHKIELSNEQLNFVKAEIQEKEKIRVLRNKISQELTDKFQQTIKDNYDKLKVMQEDIYKDFEEEYNKKIKEKEKIIEENRAVYIKEIEALKTKNAGLQEEISKFKSILDSIQESIKEQQKKINMIDKKKDELIKEKEKLANEKNYLQQEVIRLKSIDINRLINDQDIKEIFEAIKSHHTEEKFKEYLDKYIDKEHDEVDMKEYWKKWLNNENDTVLQFLNVVLFEQGLNSKNVELLNDIEYSLHLRLMLIKVFQSISYKYLSNKKYNEIFS